MAVDTKPHTAPESRRVRNRSGRVLRALGKTFIGMGVLILLFVAYELWGTGVVTSRAQGDMRDDITKNGFAARPLPGDAIGYIRIPKIDLDMIFVEGAGVIELKRGPGHYPDTPLPGSPGNVGLAGHRTTYLHPFWDLNRVHAGDLIELQTRRGTFRYEVRWQRIVDPHAVWVLNRTKVPALTLTTCHPRYSARQRLVIRAIQVAGPGTPRGGGAA